MRTFEEIKADIDEATGSGRANVLVACASELDALGTKQAEALAHRARGVAALFQGQFNSALEHFHSTLLLFEELGDRSGVAGVTGNIGLIHANTGDFPAALEFTHRALAIHEELGNNTFVAAVTGNIGIVHSSTGNYPKALEHYHRAQTLLEELGDRSGVARVTGNIGIVHQSTGDHAAALVHFHRALSLHEELGERSGVALVTGNIGAVHASNTDYEAAIKDYLSALALHEQLGERSGVARVMGNIGQAYVELGRYDDAQKVLDDMHDLEIAIPSTRVGLHVLHARLEQARGDLDSAAALYGKALAEATEHNLRSSEAAVHKHLRDLAQLRNDFAGYIEHNNEFTRITAEVNGKETAMKLAMQEKQREIDAKDREVQKHMAVLHSTLPKHIADRVARGEAINDFYENASVIFMDIVGFTTISDRIPSGHVVHLLEQIFSTLDAACEKHSVVKVKTIGDSYMAVSFESVLNAATCALDMIAMLDDLEITMPPSLGDVSWTRGFGDVQVRIGIHCGPVTAGVIGTQRMQYDVWGDTVNVASRMESTSEATKVQVSEAFAVSLRELTDLPLPFAVVPRGEMKVKGKGMMHTYWLETTTP